MFNPCQQSLSFGFLMPLAVIGILASVAIPAYQDYVVRAKVAEGISLSTGAKYAVAEYWIKNADWPATNVIAGLPEPEAISGQYVASVTVAHNTIQVLFSPTDTVLRDQTILLTGTGQADGVAWTCTSTLDQRYLPAACR